MRIAPNGQAGNTERVHWEIKKNLSTSKHEQAQPFSSHALKHQLNA
ncbi:MULTISPECIES: hypothetical protein [unclassified Bradyrhizobium]|nr:MULTISPECIES: hypothetical protein [unclassified Bradyrhizobium]MDH2346049.1 hypothetical protein [Bradyrhizobium sp. SSUT77]MDH2349626.1 hypothetical protein [Bradyrhizobium sp. SSUT112]